MKLYLISQDVNEECDTYTEAVVAAANEVEAKMIHPADSPAYTVGAGEGKDGCWVKLNSVKVKEIGLAKDPKFTGVILSSYYPNLQ